MIDWLGFPVLVIDAYLFDRGLLVCIAFSYIFKRQLLIWFIFWILWYFVQKAPGLNILQKLGNFAALSLVHRTIWCFPVAEYARELTMLALRSQILALCTLITSRGYSIVWSSRLFLQEYFFIWLFCLLCCHLTVVLLSDVRKALSWHFGHKIFIMSSILHRRSILEDFLLFDGSFTRILV